MVGTSFQDNEVVIDWVNEQPLACTITCIGDGHDGIWKRENVSQVPRLFHSEHNEPRNEFHGLKFQVRLNGLWLLDREFILWLGRMK